MDTLTRQITEDDHLIVGLLINMRLRAISDMYTGMGTEAARIRANLASEVAALKHAYVSIVTGPITVPALTWEEAAKHISDDEDSLTLEPEVRAAFDQAVALHGQPEIGRGLGQRLTGYLLDSHKLFPMYLDQIVNDRLAETARAERERINNYGPE